MRDEEMSKGRQPEVATKDLVEAAKSINDPCFGTSELADIVGTSNQTVRNKIGVLVEQEVFATKKVGSARVYWLVGY